MSRKIRIQRKRRPILHTKTKQLFALGNVCTNFLRFFATYGGGAGKEAYTIARTSNVVVDTRLKIERESKLVQENQLHELKLIETRLKLEREFGRTNVARLLGEPIPPGSDDFSNVPHVEE